MLSAASGVYVDAVGRMWLFLRGQVPVVKALFGEQDVKPSVTTGIQYQVL